MPLRRDSVPMLLFTTSGAAAAVACLAWAIPNLGSPTSDQQVYLWLGVALMAMGAAFSVRLPRVSMRVTLTPMACLVCAWVLPAPWVIVTAAAGVSVARLVSRRPRSAWLHKAVHNTSMDIIAAALAAGVMVTLGVRPVLSEPPSTALPVANSLVALAIAAVVVVGSGELVTTVAVTLSTKRPFGVALRGLWLTRLSVAAAEIVLAGVVTMATALDMRVLVGLPAVMLVVHLVLAHRLRVSEERRTWERLAALSEALTSREVDVVLRTAAGGAVDLFDVPAADIEISAGERVVRARQHGGVARLVYDGPADDAPDAGDAQYPMPFGVSGAADGIHGVLTLYLGEPGRTLSAREDVTLRAFAATLSSSLDLAHAYNRLSQEARRHQALASHDVDTGLLNRTGLLYHLDQGRGEPGRTVHAVVIRLDNYAFLADAAGRDCALDLLRVLADRLRRAFPDENSVARVGDVTFALVMSDVTVGVAYQRACWTVAALRREIPLDGHRLVVRASAGMASGVPGADLLDAAERVLWRANQRGDDRLVSYQAGPVREWSLARELNSSRLSIAFEPIVDLASGRITMMQAVPRWLYSRHEVLACDEYVFQLIDAADGSLDILARRVVARSLAAAAVWRDVLPDVAMVVPIPAAALTQSFVESVRDLLGKHSATSGRSLVLAVGAPPDPSAREAAEWIGQFGVRLLMDRFGSGHVGLEALAAGEWSMLRLDPAYALDAGWQPARSVIRAAVDLATDLDLSVVAPGIRTEKERRELAGLGCALGSGPLVGGEMFPSQVRDHALLWQPKALSGGAKVVQLHRARRAAAASGRGS
ncbi:EAL domain-containing protein [Micromonospora sp. C51]|uniref:EAL domain-containing protein n=1 Tax=Micromonospora sp. C51 TaxID=2824879 RepID=UPI001B3772E1|nr:EAL domain-containing protein [Micromonospora sp. C51]MBQ1049266.1 EAL domain-containing protein [Micromonospora sp. C51]